MIIRLSMILAILVVALLVACAGEETDTTLEPTPTLETATTLEPVPTSAYIPGGMHASTVFLFDRPPTLDWQILDSERIVIANFVSATAAVETLPPKTPGFRPMHVLRFRAVEYLKGTGPTEFTVEVVDHSPEWHRKRRNGDYATEAEALARATATLVERNTAWDDRSGVLFLQGPFSSVASQSSQSSESSETRSATETNQVFTLTNQDRTNQRFFDYTVDTLSRAWLPASEAASSSTRSTGGGTTTTTQTSSAEFITDGTAQPPPVISASQLRIRISEIEAMLNAGDGSIAYKGCVYAKLVRPWYFQDWEPGPPRTVSIVSAAAAGAEFGNRRDTGESAYDSIEWYFTGEHEKLFEVGIRDTDNNPGNGFNNSYRTARPLVAGEYRLQLHNQIEAQEPCNFREPHDEPGHFLYHVTVEAPAGTLHEAFFDPVAVGTAVKADGTNGVLKPTAFTVGSTSTEITGLEWNNNQVVLTLSPHASLSGYALDFIELDGSVSLSLSAADATVDNTASTHSWRVSTDPWEDGDQLMLRIREAGTTTVPQEVTAPTPQPSTDATLSGLTLSRITIAFDPATTEYTVDVANNIRRTTVAATASDEGATAVVKLGGVADADGTVALEVGSNVITVEVTAEDGTTTQTYTISVNRAVAPLTASFSGVPPFYNGSNAFTFRIAFSEAISTRAETLREEALQVTGGEVTRARRVNSRSDLWEITVLPSPPQGVSIVLPVTTDCEANGAICTADNRPLSNRVKAKLGPRTSGGR